MEEEKTSIFRYWAAGVVFLIVALIAFAPLTFLQGFFVFLYEAYGIVSVGAIYSLLYIILVPYIFGRIIKWVSQKILLFEA